MLIETVTGDAFSDRQIADWQALAANALEANVFYEAWNLLPAIRHFGSESDLVHVLIYQDAAHGQHDSKTLTGLFPLERLNSFKGLPLSQYRLWRHIYSFLSIPLVYRGYEQATLDAFFEWQQNTANRCTLMQFRQIAADGAFHHYLTDAIYQRDSIFSITDSYTRAFLPTTEDGFAALQGTPRFRSMDKQYKKAISKRRQLQKSGTLEFRITSDTESIEHCIDKFLAMEASGWKGRDNSAIASQASHRTYFEEIARSSLAAGQSTLFGLYLDDEAIALHWNFNSANDTFFFKPAYDENYRQYYPGVLLEIEIMNYLLAHPTIRCMDSCSDTNNEVLNRMWPARKSIQSLLVSNGTLAGDLTVSALPMLRWISRLLGR